MRTSSKCRGIKLIELIISIAIIMLLMSIVLTVIVEVRRRAYEPPCMVNLRQIWVAFRNYLDDYDSNYPDTTIKLKSYLKSKTILKCPRDMYGGLNVGDTQAWGTIVSYFYLPDDEEFRRILLEKDSQHGIMYCLLHGLSRITSEGLATDSPHYLTSGTVLRLRLDGSIERVLVNSLCYQRPGESGISRVRHPWHLLTNVRPCPPEICFGLRDEWQIPCPFSFF